MEEIESYYVVVNLKTLEFLDKWDNFGKLEDAMRFDDFNKALDFLADTKTDLKNQCAIYEVSTKIFLKLKKEGREIKDKVKGIYIHKTTWNDDYSF